MMSISAVRGPLRFSWARSRPSCNSTSCARASSSRGPKVVSTAMHRLTKVRLIFEAPGRRSVVGRSRDQPHLACRRRAARPRGREWRGCRRHCRRARAAPRPWRLRTSVTPTSLKVAAIGGVRLVDRHPYLLHAGKRRQDRVRHLAGGGLDQPVAFAYKMRRSRKRRPCRMTLCRRPCPNGRRRKDRFPDQGRA